jgi:hypothetical protein
VTIRKRSARDTHLIVELTEGKNRRAGIADAFPAFK